MANITFSRQDGEVFRTTYMYGNSQIWWDIDAKNHNVKARYYDGTDGSIATLWDASTLKNDLLGRTYWSATETINITAAGQFTAGSKKITIPAGTYIVMGHATIPEGINATGRIKLDINGLYETQQSWYPSQYETEVNITTFKYFSAQTDITLSVRADKLISGITIEVASIRIN